MVIFLSQIIPDMNGIFFSEMSLATEITTSRSAVMWQKYVIRNKPSFCPLFISNYWTGGCCEIVIVIVIVIVIDI